MNEFLGSPIIVKTKIRAGKMPQSIRSWPKSLTTEFDPWNPCKSERKFFFLTVHVCVFLGI